MQHQSNSAQQATKEGEPVSGYRNWRHRKADIARRQALAEEALARSQASMQWRQDLIDTYIAALGGAAHITAVQRQDCERCADMAALATNMRRRALRGDATVKIADVVRLEGASDRAHRRLDLPAAGAAAPVMDLHDLAARRAAERANPPDGDD
jgi:hypothetical protein